jgi:AcrR family transcriptional regulator
MKEKQEQILNAALKLFVEFGFHATPTSKIAKEAGVANGTLFHYYKTKNELIVALYMFLYKKLDNYSTSSVKEEDSLELKLQKIFLNTLEWSQEHKNEFYFIQQFNTSTFSSFVSKKVIAGHETFLYKLIGDEVNSKALIPLPAELLVSIFNSQVIGITQYFLTTNHLRQKQTTLANDAFNMLWKMFH